MLPGRDQWLMNEILRRLSKCHTEKTVASLHYLLAIDEVAGMDKRPAGSFLLPTKDQHLASLLASRKQR